MSVTRHRTVGAITFVCLAAGAGAASGGRPGRTRSAGPSVSQVGSGPSLGFPISIAIDPSGALYVGDNRKATSLNTADLPVVPRAILRIDADGTRTILSDVGHGSGPGPSAEALFREADGTLIDGAVRIDPVTGDRTALPPLSPPISERIRPARLLEPGGTMLHAGSDAIVRRQPDSGTWTLVSGCVGTDCVGNGPAFRVVTTLAAAADGTLYAADLNGLTRVDPVSGDRMRLSGLEVGTGPELGTPTGLVLESDDRALWARHSAVLRIDLDTGDRTAVSDETIGSGPLLRSVEDVVREPAGTVLLADGALGAILRLDPSTGNRAIVSGGPIGTGPRPTCVSGGALDAAAKLVIADCDNGLMRIDLQTGDRTVVSGAGVGSGPAFTAASDVAVATSGELVVADVTTLKGVDPVTGDRRIVSDGAPAGFLDARVVVAEPEGTVIVGDRGRFVSIPMRFPLELQLFAALQRVDLTNGQTQLVSGGGRLSQKRGFGLGFILPLWALAVETPGTLVAFRGDDLIRVNVRNGNRRLLAGAERGTGPWLGMGHVAVDASGASFVVASRTLLRVDPVSGNRTIVASHDRGSGPMFDRARAILAEAEGTLLVVSEGTDGVQSFMSVMRVDPVTGDRTVLSRP